MTSSYGKAGVILALSLSALTACSEDGPEPRVAAPSLETTSAATTPVTSSSAAAPSPSASAAPTSSPTRARPSSQKVVLFGNDLGPAKIGDPFPAAVKALSAVLGEPGPETDDASCIRGDRGVDFGDFHVTSENGKLAGWSSESTTLATPSGIRVGTTVATLRRVYGSDLALTKPPGAESLPEFSVRGSVVQGIVDGFSPDDKVSSLFTSACSQP